jgi:hypothetical protein
MAAILDAMDISTIATAVGALLVSGVGVRLLYAGYKFVKKTLGTV